MDTIKTFKLNNQGRDFFVGDIHGAYSYLEQALEAVAFDIRCDRLFCTGDLIDRGNESHRAIEFLAQPWFYSVMGNHDRFLLGLGGETRLKNRQNWFANGGSWWSNITDTKAINTFQSLFSDLPYIIEVETTNATIGIVHAEFPLFLDIWQALKHNLTDKRTQDALFWGRTRISHQENANVQGIDLIVSGHTPIQQPVRLGNSVFIDTGAWHSQQFTLYGGNQLLTAEFPTDPVLLKGR